MNEQALAHFAAAIGADPTLGAAHAYRAAHAYHRLADAALHDHKLAPSEAKQRVRAQGLRAVQLSPGDSRTYGILSYGHPRLREFEPAEQAARRAIVLNPCDAEALFRLAVIRLNRGRPDDALERLAQAKEINPLWPACHDGEHSLALFLLGRHEQAARFLRRVTARQEMRLAASDALLGERELARQQRPVQLEPPPGPGQRAMLRCVGRKFVGSRREGLHGARAQADAPGSLRVDPLASASPSWAKDMWAPYSTQRAPSRAAARPDQASTGPARSAPRRHEIRMRRADQTAGPSSSREAGSRPTGRTWASLGRRPSARRQPPIGPP